ncbi:MAG: P-loop NTPase [Halobacteriales archaeon]|nr:P-loop NTPase [Halobacteriales archaeon]
MPDEHGHEGHAHPPPRPNAPLADKPQPKALQSSDPAVQQRAQAFMKRVEMMERIRKNMDAVRHKVVVMSGKGGVGKTTTSVNLAASFLALGRTVGVMDADLTNPNVPKMLGCEQGRVQGQQGMLLPVQAHGLQVMSTGFLAHDPQRPIIWRGPIKIGVLQQFLGDVKWGSLDYLFIDLPPGTSDEPLSIAQEIPNVDGAVIVTTPQDVSILDIKKSVGFARSLNMKVLGIVENMSGFTCPHCGKETELFKRGGGEQAAVDMGVPFLGRVPFDPRIVRRGDEGRPFVLDHGDSEAGKAFALVVQRLARELGETV